MAVLVRSSTHSKEPRFSLLRSVSVSSRFRRALMSRPMTPASVPMSTSFIRSKPVIWVRER